MGVIGAVPTPGRGVAGGGADASEAERAVLRQVREGFERAVVRRMMCDVPWGVLLSGGLDSATVLALAAQTAEIQPNRARGRLFFNRTTIAQRILTPSRTVRSLLDESTLRGP